MVQLQGKIGLAAVDTLPAEFLQHVLPQLVFGELPLLVVHARDFWVLQ
jgi:hypothetical protein